LGQSIFRAGARRLDGWRARARLAARRRDHGNSCVAGAARRWLGLGSANAATPGMSISRRSRILLVDDDINTRSALGALLRDEEHEVVLAHDGMDALAKLATFWPDVIVTDLNVPRLDGLALYEAVRRLPIPMPRFVFLSASARPDLDGEVHIVVKPIEVERLTSLVDAALERGAS
jgi:CheY-like chemotaxis protein